MNTIKAVCYTLAICAIFGAGFYTGFSIVRQKEVVVITKKEPIYNVVYRDYAAMTVNDYKTELHEYDTAPFLIDGEYNNGTFTAKASLRERSASRDFDFSVYTGNDWRVYVAVGAVGIAAGTLAAMYLAK